jgi:membrane dipeptidase
MTATVTQHALELHKSAIVIDGHSDILMAIADGMMRLADRYELPDPKTWTPPRGVPESEGAKFYGFTPHTAFFRTMGQYDLPRFREGGLTAQAMAIYIEEENINRALNRALEMVYWLNKEFEENPDFVPVTKSDQIREAKADGNVAGFLTLEGFEPLGVDLRLLDIFYALGLRMATMTHSRRNYFADGTYPGIATTGLTKAGTKAVVRMNELGIVIDLAHLSSLGCLDVIALSDAPIVLSHCSPRRHLFHGDPAGGGSDELARRVVEGIAKTGGVVGIIAWNQPTLDAFIDDIDQIIEWVGAEHVGLGTDFYGVEFSPANFAGIHHLPNLTVRLVERGYSDETIRKVLGENYLRVFDAVWR